MFYNEPVPLMLERHAEAGIKNTVNYSFSKQTNSAPITLHEFVEVAKAYPIVFTSGPVVEPAAVLGLETNKNSFVDAEGTWAKDKYIPVYIRRYPFAFMEHDNKLILCVDEESDVFVKKAKKNDLRFFDDNEQSKTTKFALDFCTQFHRDQILTRNFCQAVKDAGLLKVEQVTATFKNKKDPKTLSGFSIIDEAKLRTLDDAKLKEFNQNGYLGLIYIHLMSLSNFTKISNMA